MVFTLIMTSAVVAWLTFLMGQLIRTERVYRFRDKLIDQVYELSKKDTDKDFTWRWKEYEKVSFNDMCRKFWVPLKPENWWEDTRFLKMSDRKKLTKELFEMRDRALDKVDENAEDLSEAVDFVIDIIKELVGGDNEALIKGAIELDSYMVRGLQIFRAMERFQDNKDDLIRAVGENDEGLLTVLPVFILGRMLQNYEKRLAHERAGKK